MGRFAEKLNDEQRAVIGEAMMGGLKARQVVALAAQGKLAGLEAFETTESACWTQKHRLKKRQEKHDLSALAQAASPSLALERVCQRFVSRLDRESQKWHDRGEGMQKGQELVKFARDVAALASQLPSAQTQLQKPKAKGFLEELGDKQKVEQRRALAAEADKPRPSGPAPDTQAGRAAVERRERVKDSLAGISAERRTSLAA